MKRLLLIALLASCYSFAENTKPVPVSNNKLKNFLVNRCGLNEEKVLLLKNTIVDTSKNMYGSPKIQALRVPAGMFLVGVGLRDFRNNFIARHANGANLSYRNRTWKETLAICAGGIVGGAFISPEATQFSNKLVQYLDQWLLRKK